MMKNLIGPTAAAVLFPGPRRLYVGAYGFEARTLAWPALQAHVGGTIRDALVAHYSPSKGRNRISALRAALHSLGAASVCPLPYNVEAPSALEEVVARRYGTLLPGIDEVVLDTSAMTKLLVLVTLMQLSNFDGAVRIIYSELVDYPPTQDEYRRSSKDQEALARFPSIGVQSIVRMRCLSSIRMQGQPVTLVAFTSFNEQLVRHMLGTITPYRLIFIGGKPQRSGYEWRQLAMEDIHRRLIDEYRDDNPLALDGTLARAVDLLDYTETATLLAGICASYGQRERIICAATGSKMQTVGLFFAKAAHPDIHIEYPTPDSYFVSERGMSASLPTRNAARFSPRVREVVIPAFRSFLRALRATGER